ncbi:hypothetical protein NL676_029793 [Syzygium grande]|nr:hypothetical protein NL676_029793 [Syzygium grande]
MQRRKRQQHHLRFPWRIPESPLRVRLLASQTGISPTVASTGSNLERLKLKDCEELDISKDESGSNIILDLHGALHSLRSVIINDLPKLESLPQWLLHASNLERLQIIRCYNLKELPEQIEGLQSLQRLDICYCPSLTSLPEGMRRLASLTHLHIFDCEELDISRDESSGNIILDSQGGLHASAPWISVFFPR